MNMSVDADNRSISDYIKQGLELECTDLTESQKNQVIRTLIILIDLRHTPGYSTGIAITTLGYLEQIFNLSEPMIEITGNALIFDELSEEEANSLKSDLTDMLPANPSLEAFLKEKFNSTSDTMYKYRHIQNPMELVAAAAVGSLSSSLCAEDFELQTNGTVSQSQLIEALCEFSQKHEFVKFGDDSPFGFKAEKKDQAMLVSITHGPESILISVLFQPYSSID